MYNNEDFRKKFKRKNYSVNIKPMKSNVYITDNKKKKSTKIKLFTNLRYIMTSVIQMKFVKIVAMTTKLVSFVKYSVTYEVTFPLLFHN